MQMGWQIKYDGAAVEVQTGFQTNPQTGAQIPVKRVVIGRAGQRVDNLADDLVERWEDGEEHMRSVVDKVDGEGQVVGPDGEPAGESAELQSLRAELESTKAELDSVKEENARLAAAPAESGDAGAVADQATHGTGEGTTGELAAQGSESGGSPEGETGGGGDQPYNPSEYTVDEVNDYLASDISDEERARVLEAERADKNRSTVNGIEEGSS